MKFIAFAGHLESGKSTAAEITSKYCMENNYIVYRTAFAEVFKQMCLRYFGFEVDDLYTPEGKNKVNEFWGMTSREFMQRLGQGLRDAICPDIWTKVVEKELEYRKTYGPEKQVIIIDDLRFPNEAEMLKKHGALIIKMLRPDYKPISTGIPNHPSEKDLDDKYVDLTLCNKGTVDQLKNTLVKYLIQQGF